MKSQTLPSFWDCYKTLNPRIRQQARKTYFLWKNNPFHPSLHFKCINSQENIWSVRISKSHRAIGIFEDNIFTWFWIGSHEHYEKFFS